MQRAQNERTGIPIAFSTKIGNFLEHYSGRVILIVTTLTLLLIIPLLIMGSDEQASGEPSGEVFDLRDDINERFAPSIHGALFIVESRTGDILTQVSLWELYQNEQQLREDDQRGTLAPENLPTQSYLYEEFNVSTNQPFLGVYSLADAIQDILMSDPRFNTTLETATDEQVKLALHQLFAYPSTSGLRDNLSIQTQSEKRIVNGMEIDYWTSPAMMFGVLADNEKLGGGTLEIGVGGGETIENKEEFSRKAQRVLRGDEETFRLWGIAIDTNLTAASEGQKAGYFIMATVIVVILIAGISLRSYWATVLTGTGLGCLMIWLNGISNLIGLKGGLVIDMIVPIAMISLGVDFGLHAMRRYREEKYRGYAPRMALRAAFTGVLGALVLAMVSDGVAFLSNTSSGIESVIHFGIAAAIAVISSFVILGVALPLAMTHIDRLQRYHPTSHSKRKSFMTVLNSIGVAAGIGIGVIFLVALSEALGVAILLVVIVGYLLVPLLIMFRRQSRLPSTAATTQLEMNTVTCRTADNWFVNLVVRIAHHRILVLFITISITTIATILTFRLEATFDVKDFFSSNSDFVISLDKFDEHVGETGGEPGIIYIKGDLADPRALSSIDQFITDSEFDVWSRTIINMLERVVVSEYAVSRVVTVTGIKITDSDGDGLPDSQAQLKATYAYMLAEGVHLDEDTLAYTPDQIREVLSHDPRSDKEDVTILTIPIPGTRKQENVVKARDTITKNLKVIQGSPAVTYAGLTGSPFTRLAQLEASTKTLQRSLAIAVVASLVLLFIVMRSFRYAVVTIIPIGLVVVWLYGLMYMIDLPLNYVTATIGAVSLGVGIDYSIHVTERFREEMRKASNKMQALRQAANGTGMALLASAISSIVGFTIMGFAPMPMFSTYGILTAVMISLAMLASLVVLPSLLLMVTREKVAKKTQGKSR